MSTHETISATPPVQSPELVTPPHPKTFPQRPRFRELIRSLTGPDYRKYQELLSRSEHDEEEIRAAREKWAAPIFKALEHAENYVGDAEPNGQVGPQFYLWDRICEAVKENPQVWDAVQGTVGIGQEENDREFALGLGFLAGIHYASTSGPAVYFGAQGVTEKGGESAASPELEAVQESEPLSREKAQDEESDTNTPEHRAIESVMMIDVGIPGYFDTNEFLTMCSQLELSPAFRKFSEDEDVDKFAAAKLLIAGKIYAEMRETYGQYGDKEGLA